MGGEVKGWGDKWDGCAANMLWARLARPSRRSSIYYVHTLKDWKARGGEGGAVVSEV
jgi:hypothetical protein